MTQREGLCSTFIATGKWRHAEKKRVVTVSRGAKLAPTMFGSPFPQLLLVLLLALTSAAEVAASDPATLLDSPRHLGLKGQPEWSETADRDPDGAGWELDFDSRANPTTEHCLLVRHRGVKLRWQVQFNGKTVGALPTLEQEQITAFAIPAGMLKEGPNRIAVTGPNVPDDIVLHSVILIDRPLAETLGESRLDIVVTQLGKGGGVPCRLTITTPDGALVPLRADPADQRLAIREGVAYTGDGVARLSLQAGQYIVWASRGFEWSAASVKIDARPGQTEKVSLELIHELPTPGWISVDSHIHTLTHSGHGDSSIDERMLTIAGEGIDLAVATDHNHHADYAAPAEKMGVANQFRHVIGNEVTTKKGHFNAFPITPGSPVVDAAIDDWDRLIPAIRAVPGVRVVILNHPRNLHSGFVPMGPTLFDSATGKHRHAAAFRGIDGFEVVTSAAMQSDIFLLFRDWFGLLNRGHRISAVGSSDAHDVNRYLLGQARTYVSAREPDDLDQVWKSYEEGRLLVSMGLLVDLTIEGKYHVGDLAKVSGENMNVYTRVAGPSWTRADRLSLYSNGLLIKDYPIGEPISKNEKHWGQTLLPVPKHDTYLVAIATGPGVDAPFCETPRPYQPSSRDFHPRVIGATNPVWIDGDGDGVFSAPLQTAQKLVDRHGVDPVKLISVLADFDEAIAVQAASLCADAGATRPKLPAKGVPDFVRRAYGTVWPPQ